MVSIMRKINEKNFKFYNQIGLNTFQSLAQTGGFNTFVDLEIAYRYIQTNENIIEIGAGYGRCLDFLLEKKHEGKICAIEQSAVLCEHLRAKYSRTIEIIEGDIYAYNSAHSIDTALWMWSGIIDFSVEEQAAVIKHIYDILSAKGKVFIDIPRIGIKTIADHLDQQRIKLTTDFGEIECYIPLSSEMKEYADRAGFTRMDEINYETATDKKRTMYILMK
jgi:SAM-dependent methyltransferase